MPKPTWSYHETSAWNSWRSTAGPGFLSFVTFRDVSGNVIFSVMAPFPDDIWPDTLAFEAYRRRAKKRAFQAFFNVKKTANA